MDGRANAILAIDQRNFTSIWISRAQRKTFLALIPAVYYSTSPRDSTSPFLLPSIITPFFAKKLWEPRNVIPFFYSAIIFGTIFERGCFVASIFLYRRTKQKASRFILFYSSVKEEHVPRLWNAHAIIPSAEKQKGWMRGERERVRNNRRIRNNFYFSPVYSNHSASMDDSTIGSITL